MRSTKEITAEIMEYAIASDMFVCKNIGRLCDELNRNDKEFKTEISGKVCDEFCVNKGNCEICPLDKFLNTKPKP